MRYLVIYDISDEKRLLKVAKTMEDFGKRVQKSKFEMELTKKELKKLQARIASIIDPETDGVKYIPLCKKCVAKIEIIGEGEFVNPDFEYCIV
ncbi:CRISPR-associated endonuclease Cas2 [Desulfothermus okinawensis JCM 13304]